MSNSAGTVFSRFVRLREKVEDKNAAAKIGFFPESRAWRRAALKLLND